MTRTHCRSCGEPIFWARTIGGRPMPIDYEPSTGGNIVVRDHGGDNVTASVLGLGDRRSDTEPTYVSHFTTCPDAPQWRTRA